MALRNITLRRLKMFNIAKTVCANSKSLSGLLTPRITGVHFVGGLEYSTRVKGKSGDHNLTADQEDGDKSSKKKAPSPKITLITTNLSPTVVTLEEAQKISKRRDLKLVKVLSDEHKSQRPVYKLMTGAEYFQEDLNRRKDKSAKKNSETKEPKLLTLSAKISNHDLGSKIKSIGRWLEKRHEVRIVINAGTNFEAAETICSTIEKEMKSLGKVVQKRTKGSDLKLQVVPLKKSSEADDKENKESPPPTTPAES